MSNLRAKIRRTMREAAAGSGDRNPGPGRKLLRARARDEQSEMLRRGLLLTLRRRERMIHDQARFESTRSLLAQAARLEHARARHDERHPEVVS